MLCLYFQVLLQSDSASFQSLPGTFRQLCFIFLSRVCSVISGTFGLTGATLPSMEVKLYDPIIKTRKTEARNLSNFPKAYFPFQGDSVAADNEGLSWQEMYLGFYKQSLVATVCLYSCLSYQPLGKIVCGLRGSWYHLPPQAPTEPHLAGSTEEHKGWGKRWQSALRAGTLAVQV